MSASTFHIPEGRPLRICISSPEFIGPSGQSEMAIAYTAMAQALAASGHEVTCLFLGVKDPSCIEWQRWVERYKNDGLLLVALPQINGSDLVAPSNLVKSYEAYQWLKRNDRFDIIHFPERDGPGYHTLTAKHHGLAFANATLCVGLRTMSAWLRPDSKPAVSPGEVNTEFMERRAVALADAVVRSNDNLVNWVAGPLPELDAPAPTAPSSAAHSNSVIDEAQAAIHALSVDPTNTVALKVLARMHLNAGLAEAAEEVCQLILKSNPQDAEALEMLQEASAWENQLGGQAATKETSTLPAKEKAGRNLTAPAETLESGLSAPLACS